MLKFKHCSRASEDGEAEVTRFYLGNNHHCFLTLIVRLSDKMVCLIFDTGGVTGFLPQYRRDQYVWTNDSPKVMKVSFPPKYDQKVDYQEIKPEIWYADYTRMGREAQGKEW